jgi:dUTP pyrophosphatase
MQIKLTHALCYPFRAHPSDAGADLFSVNNVTIDPDSQVLIDTGVSVAIPSGMVGFIFNRSSQGKLGIQIANGTGVIDPLYRGNLKVLLRNTSKEPYIIKALDTRIAQLVIVPIWVPNFEVYEGTDAEWENTTRGTGGFGSTGGT